MKTFITLFQEQMNQRTQVIRHSFEQQSLRISLLIFSIFLQ